MDVETEDPDLATEPLVEGRGDVSQQQPAPIRRTNNGTRRRNVHIGGGRGFNAGSNDPSSRFQHIASGYASLDRLTSAVASSFDESSQPPRRTIDIMREFNEVSQLHDNARSDREKNMYTIGLNVLEAEMQGLSGSRSLDSNSSSNQAIIDATAQVQPASVGAMGSNVASASRAQSDVARGNNRQPVSRQAIELHRQQEAAWERYGREHGNDHPNNAHLR